MIQGYNTAAAQSTVWLLLLSISCSITYSYTANVSSDVTTISAVLKGRSITPDFSVLLTLYGNPWYGIDREIRLDSMGQGNGNDIPFRHLHWYEGNYYYNHTITLLHFNNQQMILQDSCGSKRGHQSDSSSYMTLLELTALLISDRSHSDISSYV